MPASSDGFGAVGEGAGCGTMEMDRASAWPFGMVKSWTSTVQAKGPAWYLQAIRYGPGVRGPRHVAEQVNPQPYSNEPEATCSPFGWMIR